MQWSQRKLKGGGVWGAEPLSETVSNVQEYEPTEESQSRKKMDRKEEKEMMMQCNCSKGSWRGAGKRGREAPSPSGICKQCSSKMMSQRKKARRGTTDGVARGEGTREAMQWCKSQMTGGYVCGAAEPFDGNMWKR